MTDKRLAFAFALLPLGLLAACDRERAEEGTASGEVLDARFEVVETGRGGRHTYHGPGQRVGYVLLDLNRRGRDVRRFVHTLVQLCQRRALREGMQRLQQRGHCGGIGFNERR